MAGRRRKKSERAGEEESVEGAAEEVSRGRNRIIRATDEVHSARHQDIISDRGKGDFNVHSVVAQSSIRYLFARGGVVRR